MRLLLVEDDRALAEVVRRGLAEDGFSVDIAASVTAAERAFAINAYDIAVFDLGLPDGDGASLCRAQRALGNKIPIMMLTARSGTFDKVGGLDAGADDYLTKPFDFPELSARLRALLRRPADTLPMVLEVGDIRFDPSVRQVWRGESIVPLTTKEYAVLELLMRDAGRVVSKVDLLERAWDEQYDGLSNVVEACIASLRRKLETAGDPAPIETVRGAGYRLLGEPVPNDPANGANQ